MYKISYMISGNILSFLLIKLPNKSPQKDPSSVLVQNLCLDVPSVRTLENYFFEILFQIRIQESPFTFINAHMADNLSATRSFSSVYVLGHFCANGRLEGNHHGRLGVNHFKYKSKCQVRLLIDKNKPFSRCV